MLHHHRLPMREGPVRIYGRSGGASSINAGNSAYYMIKCSSRFSSGWRPVPDSGDPGHAVVG